MLKRTITSFVAIAALSTGAIAQQPTSTGFYGGLGLGESRADSNRGLTDDKDNVWKLFAGYQFNRYIAIEGGYADIGKFSASIPSGSASFDTKLLQVSAVGSLPLTTQWALTGKLGMARTDTDISGNVGGTPVASSDRDTNPTYGVGVRYDFNRTFGLRGEWERFETGGGSVAGNSDVDVFSINGIVRFY
jgi:OOP family OmpA-OmpF porin